VTTSGQRVRVYYNLHKRCLSVMDKKTRLVIAHVPSIHLEDARFIVSKAGLVRVRREGRKGVIAFVEGTYVGKYGEGSKGWSRAYFNPYRVDHFVIGAQPIHEADQVCIVNNQIYVKESKCAIS